MNQRKPIKASGASASTIKVVECPICLEVMKPPIIYCKVGHALCKSCFERANMKCCPQCRGPMSSQRHVGFEQLVECIRDKLKIACQYEAKGCTYAVKEDTKALHERDCRFRPFHCEGAKFAEWNCNWTGSYEQLNDHYNCFHKTQTGNFKTESTVTLNFNRLFKDLKLISFYNGQAYFYYKCFVDVSKERIYWAFQYIGLKCNAEHYFYEFELYKGPIRKLKFSELCFNDTAPVEDIFAKENCVVVSFTQARNFLHSDGSLSFRFRILKQKHNS